MFRTLVNKDKINLRKVHSLISRINQGQHSHGDMWRVMDNDNRKQMRNLHEKNRSKSRTKSKDFEEVATFMMSNPKVLENMLR